KTDRLVTVMSTGSAYARSAETEYRTDDGTMQTGKVKTDSVVHVQDRAISALSLAERLQLAEHRGTPIPGAQALTGGQLDDNVARRCCAGRDPSSSRASCAVR